MMRCLVMLVVACGAPSPTSHDSVHAPASRDEVHVPPTGPFTLPASWTSCTTDDDCTIASLGCCDETPVNRAHVDAMRKQLEASGRRYCPPKSACGPGPGGTWDGGRGVCVSGTCQMPKWP